MTQYEKLIQYALRIISKKRYTGFEIEKKLAQKNDESQTENEAVSAVLERLKELNYLNDASYADDYISDRKKFRPRGKFLLARELKKKGLDSDLIKNALEKQQLDEFEIATRALEKKSRQWRSLPLQKQRERAYRFLSARGFDQDAIYKAINHCYNQIIK